MKAAKVTLRILRYTPLQAGPPRYRDFTVHPKPNMTVLDALEEIRHHQDDTLMYRHSCHHASCGTCACTINGSPALACMTRIEELKEGVLTLAPLDNYRCLGDLVVDMRPFFKSIDPRWRHVRQCKRVGAGNTLAGAATPMRFENCIECGCCVAACPVTVSGEDFVGPAALAALHNELMNRPTQRDHLLEMAAHPNAAAMCRRHLVCSRVCPSNVYPARHIDNLLRLIAGS